MVENPTDYRWSSYHCNAMGEASALIRPRLEYHALGRTPEERQKYYQALFQKPLDKATLNEIREATNKSWVLGDNKCKEAVEQQLARRVTPIAI